LYTFFPKIGAPSSPDQPHDEGGPAGAGGSGILQPGGAHFLFADGAVRFLPYAADGILPALATRAGGEPVGSLD
jgi:prepilin-type processing-associated H-X9-DG protein